MAMAAPPEQMTDEVAAELRKTFTTEAVPAHTQSVTGTSAAEKDSDNNHHPMALQRTVSSINPKYPNAAKLTIILTSLYVSVFLIALDRTIIGVAIPRITNQFHSLNDIGWYGSAYMLTACGFILTFGKIYTFCSTKWTFLAGIVLFEIGSAICGAAPNSIALIIGRAIAGLGSSGIFTGAIAILLSSVSLEKRAIFQGLFGACFGLASVAGPLLGGAFTQGHLGWRWCFYINLPIGAFTVAAILIFLHLDEKKQQKPFFQELRKLDPLGTLFFLPAIVCLLLALQWGGSKYAWSEWRVIICLVFFAILITGFLAVQAINRHKDPLVPARIFFQRSVFFGGLYQFMLGSSMLTTVVYIPLWFQAIKGVSPVKSGIDSIPQVLGVVIGSILSGALVNRFGYYLPFMYLGTVLMSIGNGLLTTLTPTAPSSHWIGYQAVAGLGIGFGMQQSNLAVQRCLNKLDVNIGVSIIFFFQTLGGAIFMSVGQNVFITKFIKALEKIPGIENPGALVNVGATALRSSVPPDLLPAVINAYNYSVTKGPFLVATICGALSIIGCLGSEWLSIKTKNDDKARIPQAATNDLESGIIDTEKQDNQNQNPASIHDDVPVKENSHRRSTETEVKSAS